MLLSSIFLNKLLLSIPIILKTQFCVKTDGVAFFNSNPSLLFFAYIMIFQFIACTTRLHLKVVVLI